MIGGTSSPLFIASLHSGSTAYLEHVAWRALMSSVTDDRTWGESRKEERRDKDDSRDVSKLSRSRVGGGGLSM